VRNALGKTMWLYGMGQSRGLADSTAIPAGGTRELRFTMREPGTFYYAGRTSDGPVFGRTTEDGQLGGIIIADPAGLSARQRDRVFVITNWFLFPDTTTVSGLGPNATLAINGLSWPYTERLAATQGDSLRWRVVNMSVLEHPMHLHGFYFRVDATGNSARDSIYSAPDRRMTVTELLLPGRTMAMTWSPSKSGNWIFHCHFAGHIATRAALEMDRRMPEAHAAAAHAGHSTGAMHGMQGLIMGIRVKPRGRVVASTGPARPIRLLIRSRASIYGDYVGYSYVLGGSPEESNPSALPTPGPTLTLTKDQPVAINIVNTSHEPAAIHWHGIELESFPDGVPGWSGSGRNTLPMIPARDSLTVRFTPPRAGTFMYHSHSNENQQIASGLYGAIVVVDPARPRDPETDRILLFSDNGPTINFLRPPPGTLLNGKTSLDTMELRAGTTYRLRLINIRTDYLLDVGLYAGDTAAEWRVVARDGADLPQHQSITGPARLSHFAPGQIMDVELTPRAPGMLTLRHAMVGLPGDTSKVAIRVR
ncbi:MAG TPA: multicopper oxidase domain-containing protein, partial [Gemmatimonadaceae bacterium]|nr:multicopper oxidase domain-containing protein [Gemmatimonadaceae bacterium]